MNTNNTLVSDTSLMGALTVNAKLVASSVTTLLGYAAGGFVAVADTATTHAVKNPDGVISHALSTPLIDHWRNARKHGYELVEEAKSVVDFGKLSVNVKEEEK